MRRRESPSPPRFQDLPGWKESFEAALRAKEKVRAGHWVAYVGVQSLRTVGNMVPPPSVTFVTTNFLLCLAIGFETFRGAKSSRRDDARILSGKVIDFEKASLAIQFSTPARRAKHCGGQDPWDPAVWSRRGKPPYPVAKALSAARREGDDPEEGAAE